MRAWLAIAGPGLGMACGRIAFDPRVSSDALGTSDTVDAFGGLAGLIAHWKLDAGMGTVARDSVGMTDGVLSGGSVGPPMWVEGHNGDTALGFVGDGDRVFMGTPPIATNLPMFTITAWIDPDSISILGGEHVVVDKGEVDKGWAFGISTVADGDLWFRGQYAGEKAQRASAGALLAIGRWFHIAASWDGTNQAAGIALYIDGAPAAPGPSSNATSARPDDSIVGLSLNNNSTSGYIGAIDDVQLYNRVLTPAEIAIIYNATK